METNPTPTTTVIVVFGASGDLAHKKTYPALFSLFNQGFLLPPFKIIGYARSKTDLPSFIQKAVSKIPAVFSNTPKLAHFCDSLGYVSGQYDQTPDGYLELAAQIGEFELPNQQHSQNEQRGGQRRVFYMALPPSMFIQASKGIKQYLYSKTGQNRLVVEKPFGKDLASAKTLSMALSQDWNESEIYRIDHYLGKEMVKNIMVLRYANIIFDAVWDRKHIDNVQITFKEPFGTEGRGGYFDEFGIIRDVMQNHLFQILTLIAMEKPQSLNAEHIRDEKVKLMSHILPVNMEDILVAQYTTWNGKPGYLDDPTVPKGSKTCTFSVVVFFINNERWKGVPFILKCGKALNEQKAEVRIQFKDVDQSLYPKANRNELVIRVQPNESVYMKFTNKTPGLGNDLTTFELDLNYALRMAETRIPDAYESLILDVLKGDKSNFVRDDELEMAWSIFTPLLNHIESNGVVPHSYPYGSRGPVQLDAFVAKYGFKREEGYTWTSPKM